MSLLDDVSIVVTPNGYKAGTLFAVKPTIAYGSELVVNGDFSEGDTGWTIEAVWTISGGAAHGNGATGSSQELKQAILEVGKTYEFSYEIRNRVSGSVELLNSGLGSTFSNQVYTSIGIATSTELRFRPSSFNGDIYNVSVREFTGADMDVTRATAATRVDENGLVNYAEVIGSDVVTNGDFSGGSTGWTLSGAWSLGTNKVIFGDTTNGDIRTASNIFTASKTYQIKLTVADLTGSNTAFFGIGDGSASNLVGYDNYANGEYTFNAIAPNGSQLRIYSTTFSGSSYSITNISVKEIQRDNVPRIDYTGGGCPHILAEPQRTNLVTYSEDFTQWTKSNASLINTITSTVISPDGVSYANKLYPIGTGGYIKQTIAGDCFSIFVKKGERKWILIYGGFANSNVWFDSENGVLGTVKSEATATVESFGNDWYRIKILWTQNSTQVRIYNTDNDNTLVSTGNGTDGLYIWGAQLEEASYATSYIPTDGSTVTRVQDQFSRDGITSLINSEEGTLVIEPRYFIDDGSSRKISISDGTGSNRIYITPWQGVASRIRYIFTNGGSTQADLFFSGIDLTVSNKFAFVWATNRFELWQNGVKLSEDTSGTTPSAGTFNQINFGSETGSATELFEGELKQLQVYKTALTDTELATLTT